MMGSDLDQAARAGRPTAAAAAACRAPGRRARAPTPPRARACAVRRTAMATPIGDVGDGARGGQRGGRRERRRPGRQPTPSSQPGPSATSPVTIQKSASTASTSGLSEVEPRKPALLHRGGLGCQRRAERARRDAGEARPGRRDRRRRRASISSRAVERSGGRQPSRPMRSPSAKRQRAPASRGTRHEARRRRGRASGDRRRATSSSDRRSGPAISSAMRRRRVGLAGRTDGRARGRRAARPAGARCRATRGTMRQRREPAEQRAAAVGLARPTTTDGRRTTHSRSRAISASSPASLVRAKAVGGAAVDADRRDLHDAPHARLLAGREQRGGAAGMHAGGGVARAVLQHAGAVDDRVDAGQMRQPVGGAGRPGRCRARRSAPPAAAGRRRRRCGRPPPPRAPRRARPRQHRARRSGRSPPSAARASQPPSSIRQCRRHTTSGSCVAPSFLGPPQAHRRDGAMRVDCISIGLGGCGLVALLINE